MGMNVPLILESWVAERYVLDVMPAEGSHVDLGISVHNPLQGYSLAVKWRLTA